MSERPEFSIAEGLPEAMRDAAARLYLEAFGQKLGPIIGRDDRALQFLAENFRTSQALVALTPGGALLGLAGFHDRQGGLVGGDWAALTAAYGFLGALWRAPVLSIFERAPAPDQLLMDGVVVAAEARGQGVGGALLSAIEDLARARGMNAIRLDVVDTNPRARALYERRGFAAKATSSIGPFARIFGFRRSTTMVKTC